MYYFVRITPVNVIYALWLSFRKPVAAWKIQVPAWIASRFHRVRPYRLWSRDEWLLAHDAAFDLWKHRAFPILSGRHRAAESIAGRGVDFSRNLWQMLGIEFEALALFVLMLEKEYPVGTSMPDVVEPAIAGAFNRTELADLFPRIGIMRSRTNRCLENAYEWFVSAAHLGRMLLYAGGSFSRRRLDLGRRAIAWLGISPQEIPDGDDQLNFAWAAQYGHVRAGEVVFFLPSALNEAQRAYLQRHNIASVAPAAIFDLLSTPARLRVIASSMRGFVTAGLRASAGAAYLARFMTRAPCWDALLTELHTRIYVTTTSYSWPEKPELAVTAARGIRSIMWAYSANSPTFTVSERAFRDVGVVRSLPLVTEFWSWNRAFAEWFQRRQVREFDTRNLRIVGPLMCGDPSLLALDTATARRRLNLPADGICLGVFDMPPMNDGWRDRYGGGPPMISFESYIAFWETIRGILDRVPQAFALIKLKRGFTHPYRVLPDVLTATIAENGELVKSGRIRLIDVNIDPYLPIAASDVTIGVPYTSPILAARTAGKPGFYLDPLGLANFPSAPEYGEITVRNEDDAIAIIEGARSGIARPITCDLDSITPPLPVFPLDAMSEVFDAVASPSKDREAVNT